MIVGAGGFGREVLTWARQLPENGAAWEIGGFVDDSPRESPDVRCQVPLLASVDEFVPGEEDLLVAAIGDPRGRRTVVQRLTEKGGHFLTLLHPSAVVGERNRVGTGCVLCPGAVLTCDTSIGDFVIVNVHACVGHDACIGSFCTLSPHVDLTGSVAIGDAVLLGVHASVLPGVSVGSEAIVGAGSVVVRNVPPRVSVFGVPARKIRDIR